MALACTWTTTYRCNGAHRRRIRRSDRPWPPKTGRHRNRHSLHCRRRTRRMRPGSFPSWPCHRIRHTRSTTSASHAQAVDATYRETVPVTHPACIKDACLFTGVAPIHVIARTRPVAVTRATMPTRDVLVRGAFGALTAVAGEPRVARTDVAGAGAVARAAVRGDTRRVVAGACAARPSGVALTLATDAGAMRGAVAGARRCAAITRAAAPHRIPLIAHARPCAAIAGAVQARGAAGSVLAGGALEAGGAVACAVAVAVAAVQAWRRAVPICRGVSRVTQRCGVGVGSLTFTCLAVIPLGAHACVVTAAARRAFERTGFRAGFA